MKIEAGKPEIIGGSPKKEFSNNGLNIILLGMPGSGKSTVGEIVASDLGLRFIDIDKYIVDRKLGGKSVSEFIGGFENTDEGWSEFRKQESAAIKELARRRRGVVMATGGGAVLNPENTANLLHNGVTILLEAPLEVLANRADNKIDPNRPSQAPNATTLEDFTNRWNARKELYLGAADYKVENSGDDPRVAAKKITHAYKNFKLK